MTLHRISQRLFLGAIIIMFTFAAVVLAQETPPAEAQEQEAEAVLTEFEGTVKMGLGHYFYLPAAKGYDVFVQGMIQGQDSSSLVDKEVRVTGAISEVEPQVFIAETIEVKDASGQYQNVFTRTEEPTLDDYISVRARDEFAPLADLAYNKAENWEGKGKAKVYGQLADNAIVIRDERNREIGKILVDNMSDFAKYYIQKLSLFDKFWFYINIKDTVDWSSRRRTHDLFFAGLY
jgi:hypothetical protein